MRSSLCIVALAACVGTEDPTVVPVLATAGESVTLSTDLGGTGMEHRWVIIKAPDDAVTRTPTGGASVQFTPPERGIYVVDHWLDDEVAELLTHHFLIAAAGTPPVAQVSAPRTMPVGSTLTLDGLRSSSPEGLPLVYAWRLTTRPRASTAELSTLDGPTTELILDASGVYEVQLEVFDGEQWSAMPARAIVSTTN